MSFSDSDAQRLLRVVEEQVDRALSRKPYTTYGTVSTINNTTAKATVFLFGDATASNGFSYPRHMSPLVGDMVRVVIDPRGDRYIEQTYGPGGGSPAGAIVAYGGASAPSGWLMCTGSTVSRSTYAALFSAIGTTYGAGDGSTTFGLPNLQQRFPLGKASSGTGVTLGSTGGAIDHVHSGPSHTHSHNHTLSSHTHTLSHSHTLSSNGYALVMMTAQYLRMNRITSGVASWSYNFQNFFGQNASGSGTETAATSLDGVTDGASVTTTSGPNTPNTDTDATAGGTANTGSNNPPYQVVNYIIKT